MRRTGRGPSGSCPVVHWNFNMKKCLRLGLLLGWGVCAAWAVDWKSLRPEGYVSDFAHVIDPATRAQLEAYCGAVEHSTGAQMALVARPDRLHRPSDRFLGQGAAAQSVAVGPGGALRRSCVAFS